MTNGQQAVGNTYMYIYICIYKYIVHNYKYIHIYREREIYPIAAISINSIDRLLIAYRLPMPMPWAGPGPNTNPTQQKHIRCKLKSGAEQANGKQGQQNLSPATKHKRQTKYTAQKYTAHRGKLS